MSSSKTMKAWAIQIEQAEKIPAVFQNQMEQALEEDAAFPYIIFAPANEKTGKPAKDTLLTITKGAVWVLVDESHQVAVVRSLQSWVTFCGKTAAGNECVVVYYDSVMEDLFVPVLETIRTKMLQLPAEAQEIQADELHYLKDVSLKFINPTFSF